MIITHSVADNASLLLPLFCGRRTTHHRLLLLLCFTCYSCLETDERRQSRECVIVKLSSPTVERSSVLFKCRAHLEQIARASLLLLPFRIPKGLLYFLYVFAVIKWILIIHCAKLRCLKYLVVGGGEIVKINTITESSQGGM